MYCGNIFCLMAVSKPSECTCRCEGEWHGAGRIPVSIAEPKREVATA